MKKRLYSRGFIVTASVIVFLIIIEFLFDVAEIGLGEIIDWTNPLRPTSGAVWSLEQKDQQAAEKLITLVEDIPEVTPEISSFSSFDNLLQALQPGKELIISKENFIELYTGLPYTFRQDIVSPFEMIRIARDSNWKTTKIARTGEQLSIYLLDGADQPMRDFYPALAKYQSPVQVSGEQVEHLSEHEEFRNRIITADEFYDAFNSLPLAKKAYIMNNPIQLLKWGDALQHVAISRYVFNGSVSIGFEVREGIGSEIYQYQANELATTHLVKRLNELYPEKHLTMPERKESEIETP
ncbi:hypothetical protein JXJ21_11755 [candidate division KSB1 bacterium]|nr:hypothetical protein [candidate division KSB1 bacterium]